MKMLRTFLVLLLCAVLPLTGLAASGLAGECPIQQSTAMDDGNGMSASMSSCDMMKSSSAGKAKGGFCKATAQCQFGSIYYPAPPATISRPMAVSHPVVFHYAQSLFVREPGDLWRPPQAI